MDHRCPDNDCICFGYLGSDLGELGAVLGIGGSRCRRWHRGQSHEHDGFGQEVGQPVLTGPHLTGILQGSRT